MAFCSKCNSEIGEYEKFCPNCGYPQQRKFRVEESVEFEQFEIMRPMGEDEEVVRITEKSSINYKAKIYSLVVIALPLVFAAAIYFMLNK